MVLGMGASERRVVEERERSKWGGRKAKDYAEDTEDAEFTEKRRATEVTGRKSPPFAKGAKDGAPSSSFVVWR
jgi:hypothetical protein